MCSLRTMRRLRPLRQEAGHASVRIQYVAREFDHGVAVAGQVHPVGVASDQLSPDPLLEAADMLMVDCCRPSREPAAVKLRRSTTARKLRRTGGGTFNAELVIMNLACCYVGDQIPGGRAGQPPDGGSRVRRSGFCRAGLGWQVWVGRCGLVGPSPRRPAGRDRTLPRAPRARR